MRWVVCVLLLVVFSIESKAGVFLIPEHNPRPDYPVALQGAGIIGEVRVGFTVRADGSVSKVNILKSDHPELAEATRVAIAQWRFKPWTVKGDQPKEQDVIAPMMFGFDAYLAIDSNQWLKELKCRDLNAALAHAPEHEWADSAPFHYTRAYLSSAFSTAMLSNEERLALIASLNRKVPIIVRNCRSSPVSRYVRFLPQEIKVLL